MLQIGKMCKYSDWLNRKLIKVNIN